MTFNQTIVPQCNQCNEQQWSVMDRNYLRMYKHCWSCDKREWEAGRLSLEEFEEREADALDSLSK